jgi:ribonuclease E
MDEVLVDDTKVFQEARDFFQQVMPEYARLVKLHQERRPIFARYQIEEQIETISKNKVPLPSGGSIVIDQTEALVAVDVNSGKMASEQGVEATAYKTNLEAAAEVGRQLRLRDLGGLIVIDFIDMRDRKHIREVEKSLKDALKNDKARVTVGRISQFGIMEMSRQRIKATLAEGAYLTCPHCFGSGKIKSPEAQAVAFLRKVQAGVAKGSIGLVEGEVPLDVAIYLLNSKREELHEMERQRGLSIFIKGHPGFVAGQTELTFHKREKEKAEPEYVSAASAVAVAESEPETEPAAAAEPQEIEAVPEVSETTDLLEVATEAPGEGKKKRRRRRRKKKGEPETGTPEEGEAAAGEAEEAESAAEAAEEPAPVAEEVRSKPKRRRSRKKKSAPVEAPAGGEAAAPKEPFSAETPEASETHPSPAPEPVPTAEPESPSAAEAVEKKPARRRSREKAAEPRDVPADAQKQGVAAESQVPEMAPIEKVVKAEPAPESPQESKPKRSRPRKKVQSVEPPGKPEEEIAEESPPAKRKRTVKPKARAKAAQSDTAPMPAETETSSAAPSPEKTTEEKSGAPRTTRPRTKKKESGASTAEAKPQPDVPEEKTAAEDKPKKRAPRKKASPAKKTDDKATSETTEQA